MRETKNMKLGEVRDFCGTHIDYILRNERYTGKYIFEYGRKKKDYDPKKNIIVVEGGMPQIIPQSTFDAVQQILKQRVKNSHMAVEKYLLSGKITCGECGAIYSGARQIKRGKSYPYYKCNRQYTYKNGRKFNDNCTNNTTQRDKMEKYVVRELLKILSSEITIGKMLEEYNRYASELTSNKELISKYEHQLNEIDKKISNLVAVISAGHFNETLQTNIESLEAEKKRITSIIAEEQKAITYLPATKSELKQVYKKALKQLEHGSFEERKTIINMFLNKIVIFRKTAEIYINLIPLSHLSGIDLNITLNEIMAENTANPLNTPQITTCDSENRPNSSKPIEKDDLLSSLTISPIHSENFSGVSNGIRTHDLRNHNPTL